MPLPQVNVCKRVHIIDLGIALGSYNKIAQLIRLYVASLNLAP
jgi:hypothetical protein